MEQALQSKMQLIVGLGEMKTSWDKNSVLVTYSLGSCLGVSLYDPEAGVGGMIHCMLPRAQVDSEKAKDNPFRFVDAGIPLFLQTLFNLGARRKSLIAKVAGAACVYDDHGLFRIGERNYTVLRKILWKNDILITGEQIGGSLSRTMYLYMDSGKTIIRSGKTLFEI